MADSNEARGAPENEAEARAWATVNKKSGGGKLSVIRPWVPENHASSRKGGRLGGRASASPASARSLSATKAAATRKREALAR